MQSTVTQEFQCNKILCDEELLKKPVSQSKLLVVGQKTCSNIEVEPRSPVMPPTPVPLLRIKLPRMKDLSLLDAGTNYTFISQENRRKIQRGISHLKKELYKCNLCSFVGSRKKVNVRIGQHFLRYFCRSGLQSAS